MANYKLIDPANAANFLDLFGVTDDQFVDNERERESFVVIGRGKKVNYGTLVGVSGTITTKIRERAGVTASTALDNLRTFVATYYPIKIETPWGDQWTCDIGPLQVARVAGTGESEAVDVSFTYEQLEADL